MPRDAAHQIGGLPKKPRGVRAQSSWELRKAIFDLRESGLRWGEVAKQLGLSWQSMNYHRKKGPIAPDDPGPIAATSPSRLRASVAAEEAASKPPPDLEPAYIPDETTPAGSIDFLKSVQADLRVPITERIKCAIAVARLETAKEASAWTPPSDSNLWAEAMADAFKASSLEAQSKAREKLSIPPEPTPLAPTVSEEGA